MFDRAALRAMEAAAAGTADHPVLMARAGLSVARLTRALWPHARRAVVWAGPGNNGGDGLVAARHLREAGWQVRVLACGAASLDAWHARLPADAAWAARQLEAAGGTPALWLPGDPAPADADVAIDALLGIGLRNAPRQDISAAVQAMNAAGLPVLAVDVPSGLDAVTGTAAGAVVQADATLSLLGLKPGLCTGPAAPCCGALWMDDLDVAEADRPPPAARTIGADTARRVLPDLRAAAHKGKRGDVAVIGGATGMVGAALLAARSAQMLGAGRVFAGLLAQGAPVVDPVHPGLMLRPVESLLERLAEQKPGSRTVAVFGPGAGIDGAAAKCLDVLLSSAVPLVIDADGLNLLARAAPRKPRTAPLILTPHPLEAARLLEQDVQTVESDRIAATRALAERHGAWVVLKGGGSVVCAPDGAAWINPTGNGLLATAGSGDVLAGAAGALLAATGTPRSLLAAVWLHGRAADEAAAQDHAGAFHAERIAGRMAAAWNRLLAR